MIKHALCGRMAESLTPGGIFWCSVAGSHLPASRFIFAAGGSSGGSGSGGTADKIDPDKDDDKADKDAEKKDKVTVTQSNAREVVQTLGKDKKIDSANVAKCLKILEKGSEEDKKALIPHLQRASDGTLSLSEFNKFLSEVEKKTPAKADEDKEKEKDDEKELSFDVKKKVEAQTEEAVSTSGKAASAMMGASPESQEYAERIKAFHADFKRLNEDDKKFNEPIQSSLKEMADENQITSVLAYQLYEVDFNDEGGKGKWAELVKDITDPKAKAAIEAVYKLKVKEAENDVKIKKETLEKMHEFRELMSEVGTEVHKKLNREKQLEVFASAAGLPLKADQILVYKGFRENGKTGEVEEINEKAKIKGIETEDVIIKDDKGRVTQKLPGSPIIVIESLDTDSKVIRTDRFSVADFLTWIDKFGVTEDIQTKKDLEKSIGVDVNEGDRFEYRQLLDATTQNFSPKDSLVRVEKIDHDKQQITLDQEVLITPTQKVKTLNFAHFARWFKRNEVMKPIESAAKLREALVQHNEILNQVYKRDPNLYKPIQAVSGEVLKYDDVESEKKFVIKEIDDKKVVMKNGDTFTPAAFLRWVKKNHIIKKPPEEAVKAAEGGAAGAAALAGAAAGAAGAGGPEGPEHGQGAGQPPVAKSAEEKIPEDAVFDTGNEAPRHPTSYLRQMWDDTTIVSLYDLFEIGKTTYELVERKLKRWSHGKVGIAGEAMFKGYHGLSSFFTELGAEFKGVAQHAENEEVNHHVEHYRTMGIDFIKHELHEAPNKDILKASITVLAEKGQLRWDDEHFWHCINKHSHGVPVFVNAATHMDDIEKVLDHWWGNDTFREFRQKQDSSYNSIKSAFADNAKRLEGDPYHNGGLKTALKSLLYKHLNGEYVNPAEYEAYLCYAIQAGKLGFEEKIYFMVMAIGAHPHKGHGLPLFHIDRNGALNSDLLKNMPVLDFFANRSDFPMVDSEGRPLYEKDPNTGETKPQLGKADLNVFKHWIRLYVEPDLQGGTAGVTDYKKQMGPGTKFKDFVNDEVLWHDSSLKRMNKAVGDANIWDHDDMDKFAPPLGEETIEQLTLKAGGAKQQITNEGLKNCYAGFNDFSLRKMKLIDKYLKAGDQENAQKELRNLVNIMRSFIRFDAILDRRWEPASNNYSRFGSQELNSRPVNDPSRPVIKHRDEMRAFIKALSGQFGLKSEVDMVFKNFGAAPSTTDREQQKNSISEFGKMLEGQMHGKKLEELNEIFAKIQRDNHAVGMNIQGIQPLPEGYDKEKAKAEAAKLAKEEITLEAYHNPEIEAGVTMVSKLEEKLNTSNPSGFSDIKKAQNARVNTIIQHIKENTYISQAGDKKLLDEEIQRLQHLIAEKENPPKPKAEADRTSESAAERPEEGGKIGGGAASGGVGGAGGAGGPGGGAT
ncbi:MAG: hypothetical protein WC843_00655 [Candidatus Gracilibacteria bacterium]|jgi:hypothetical protein